MNNMPPRFSSDMGIPLICQDLHNPSMVVSNWPLKARFSQRHCSTAATWRESVKASPVFFLFVELGHLAPQSSISKIFSGADITQRLKLGQNLSTAPSRTRRGHGSRVTTRSVSRALCGPSRVHYESRRHRTGKPANRT